MAQRKTAGVAANGQLTGHHQEEEKPELELKDFLLPNTGVSRRKVGCPKPLLLYTSDLC